MRNMFRIFEGDTYKYVSEVVYRLPSLFYLHLFQTGDKFSLPRGLKFTRGVTKLLFERFFVDGGPNSTDPAFDISSISNSILFSLILNYACK